MMDYASSFVRTGDPNALPGSNLNPRVRWKPWSNDPEAPKFAIFDVDGDTPAMRMSEEDLTHDSIYRNMNEELDPELYEQTVRRLGMSRR